MKKIITLLIISVIILCGCKTVDFETKNIPEIEKETETDFNNKQAEETKIEEQLLLVEELTASVDIEQKVVVVEKPIYIPLQEEPPVTSSGIDAAFEMVDNIKIPGKYNNSALIYDYDPNTVYMVYLQVGQATDIFLEPGEILNGDLGLSDDRFVYGLAVHYENGKQVQHIVIKPEQSGLDGSLHIYTDRRAYQIRLLSYMNVYTPIVKFNYKTSGMPWQVASSSQNILSLGTASEYVDPKYLSFDYKMSYFKKPSWLPTNVYDDGRKTYVVLDESVLQKEMPVCFENERDVLNYRVDGNVLIIDKLVEKLTLKINDQKVTVIKKKG